jgi:hypothetical protein
VTIDDDALVIERKTAGKLRGQRVRSPSDPFRGTANYEHGPGEGQILSLVQI